MCVPTIDKWRRSNRDQWKWYTSSLCEFNKGVWRLS